MPIFKTQINLELGIFSVLSLQFYCPVSSISNKKLKQIKFHAKIMRYEQEHISHSLFQTKSQEIEHIKQGGTSCRYQRL